MWWQAWPLFSLLPLSPTETGRTVRMALYCKAGGGGAPWLAGSALFHPRWAQEFCPWVLSAQRPDWLAASFQPSSLPDLRQARDRCAGGPPLGLPGTCAPSPPRRRGSTPHLEREGRPGNTEFLPSMLLGALITRTTPKVRNTDRNKDIGFI